MPKKVIFKHNVETVPSDFVAGKGNPINLNNLGFAGLAPVESFGAVSSVEVTYSSPNLTVTVDGVSDSVALPTGTDVTVTDSNSIDFTLTGQDITAKITGISSATNGQVPAKGASDTIVWTTLPSSTTNLALGTATSTTQVITNSNGTGVTLPGAALATAGLMSSTDFQKLAIQTLTDAATITWDTSSGNYARVALSGDRTLALLTNQVIGELYVLNVTATGADRILTFNSAYKDTTGVALTPVTITSGTSRSFAFQAGPVLDLHQIGGTATGGATANTVATVNGGRFTYQILSGTPVLTFDKTTPLTPTLTVAGGTIRLVEVRDTITTASSVNPVYTFNATWADAIDVDPSFITKKTVSSGQFDLDNTPQVIVSTTGTTVCTITINAVSSDMKFIFGWNNV